MHSTTSARRHGPWLALAALAACGSSDDGAADSQHADDTLDAADSQHADDTLDAADSQHADDTLADSHAAGALSGTIRSAGVAVAGARVTLFSPTLDFFAEVRSDAGGAYRFEPVAAGAYRLGVAARDLQYQEVAPTLEGDARYDFELLPESEPGRWRIVGDTLPEVFGGTNSGALLPAGGMVLCHDTINPLYLDPAASDLEAGKEVCAFDLDAVRCQLGADGQPLEPPEVREQGCHNLTHLADGRILYVGGGTLDDAGNFTPNERAVATVKILDAATRRWSVSTPLTEPRWYPGLARLADGDLLAFGGGQQDGDPGTLGSRTATADVMDRRTLAWTRTAGDMLAPGGFGPAALLFDGRVFISWYPPQLYDVAARRFSAAPNFLQPDRRTPAEGHDGCSIDATADNVASAPIPADHPDHSAVVHSDGRVVTLGIWGRAMSRGAMVEVFDPARDAWSLGAGNPTVIRAHPEVVQLPDGRILVAAGLYQRGPRPPGTNAFCYTEVADLYDVERDRWRAVAPLNKAREYHALTVLMADGRVVSIAGTAKPGLNPSAAESADNIEVFEPPYLFRGVRPRIDSLAASELARGDTIALEVSFTRRVTSITLVGLSAVTHFLDAGVPRLLSLPATQDGSSVTAQLPSDANVVMAGHYLLFAMVDDIPSLGRVVRVRAGD